MNTFNDFINVSQWLITNKYTNNNKLIIHGASAGGLLVGSSITLRPDLFHAAILECPFVDLMNTMADSNIPLTTAEWEQWGNPNTNTSYHYMNQ